MEDKCPVDHSSREKWVEKMKSSNSGSQIPESESVCPVDPSSRSSWLQKLKFTSSAPEAIEVSGTCSSDKLTNETDTSNSSTSLSKERQVSSIPRTSDNSNWIYPSQKQFFDAMTRKNWEPKEEDMKTVVPIHNLVNERTWQHILMWEKPYAQETYEKCGGIKLTSFKGDSKKLTPRAWFNSTILGAEKPFDRHDWLVDRCGVEVPYVIDFYSAESDKGGNVFLDVRPKIQSWEGFKLRMGRALGIW